MSPQNRNDLKWHPTLGAILFLILALWSCNKTTDLGDSVVSGHNVSELQVEDTFTVQCKTVKQDSFQVFGSNNQLYGLFGYSPRSLLGRYYHPNFGYSRADLVFQITPVAFNNNEDFTNILIDSVVLAIAQEGYYGASTPMMIDVYETMENLYYNSSYFSNKRVVAHSKLGSVLYTPQDPGDSVLVGSSKEPAQIRVPLNASYGQMLINNIRSTDFKTRINPLTVIVDTSKNQFTGEGSINYVSLLDKYTAIQVYYTKDNISKKASFEVGDSCVYFSTFSHNYTGTVANIALNNTSFEQSQIFIQSMQGLNGNIKIPYLKNLTSRANAIAKAEIEFVADQIPANFLVHPQLILVAKNSNGFFRNISDIKEGSEYYGGKYDLYTNTYTFNITRHIQEELILSKLDSTHTTELFIIPDKLGVYDGYSTTLLGSGRINLKIYYVNL